MKPAYLFIDGSNLYFDWLSVSHQSMDIRKFIDLVRRKFPEYDIRRTYFYCTALPDNAGQERFLHSIGCIPYVQVVEGGVKSKGISIGEETATVATDQGSDVNLAVDMVYHALKGHYDTAILVSRDSDFMGAVQRVKDEGKSVELCILKEKADMAKKLRHKADNTRFIDPYDYQSIYRTFQKKEGDDQNAEAKLSDGC